MISQDWVEKVMQYRLAVDAYCDAVDRVGSADDLGKEWRRIEVARDESERAWSALLSQRRKPLFAHTRSQAVDEVTDHGFEDLVLGDLGQFGG
jgi:hypothetical protein